MKWMVRCMLVLAGVALQVPQIHAQAAWQATLENAKQGPAFTPTEALHLDFPASVGANERAQLALELDDIDVTALADSSETGLAYTPLQALQPGMHHLHLVEYDASGAMHDHGSWTFKVAPAAPPAQVAGATAPGNAGRTAAPGNTKLRADISLGGSERVADRNIPSPEPARFSSDGSASLGMTTQGSRWRTDTEVDLLEASPQEAGSGVNAGAAPQSTRDLQLGQFNFMAQSDASRFALGDQTLPYNSLVVSQLNRRGVSGDVHIKRLGASVGAFSMRSDVISGFAHGLGVGDPDHRVSGVLLGLHPLRRDDALALTLAYASGSGAADGVGTYSVPFQKAPTGQAWGVDADSVLLEQRVHVHAAYAHSGYDFGVPTLPHRTDDARNFLFSYQTGAGASGQPAKVSGLTTLSYQSTGTYFRSLANTGITPDLREWQLAQSLNGSSWSLQGNYALDADNVDRNPALTTVYTRRVQLTAGLFPSGGADGGTGWLGTPYYSLSFDGSRSRNGMLARPGDPRTDLDITNLNASAQFSHPRWNWNLGLMLGGTTDHTGVQPDNRVFGPTLGANVTLGQTGSLGFAAQFSDTYDKVARSHSRDTSYNLFASGDLVEGRLSGQFNFSITRTAQAVSQFMGSPVPASSYSTRTLSTGLVWHALLPQSNRPGLDMSLSGVWNHGGYPTQYAMPGMATDDFQIFLKVNMVLPWRHPRSTP